MKGWQTICVNGAKGFQTELFHFKGAISRKMNHLSTTIYFSTPLCFQFGFRGWKLRALSNEQHKKSHERPTQRKRAKRHFFRP